jgi:hypothetical protein
MTTTTMNGIMPRTTPRKIRKARTKIIEQLYDDLEVYDAMCKAFDCGDLTASNKAHMSELAAADYNLASSINQLAYFDDEECRVGGEFYDSQSTIRHYDRAIDARNTKHKRKAA